MDTNLNMPKVVEDVRKAALVWNAAGIERRLKVLQEASQKLFSKQHLFEGSLKAAGFPGDIAKTYSKWSLHTANSKLLEIQAKNLVQWIGEDSTGELLVRRADGVVLLSLPIVSASFNSITMFPILLAGNGLVVCIHPNANDTGVRLIAEEVLKTTLELNGFSKDLIQLVRGYPREIAAQFMKTSGETIVYFGNWTNGNLLAQEAYAYGKKVVLELDGGDFMVVWKDAPIKESVNSACRGFDLATHPCFVPRHFLIHESVFEEFVSQLLSQSSRYSSTVEADPEKGVLIPVSEMEAYQTALEELKNIGEIRCGGYRMQADGTKDDNGTYVAPTIVTLKAKDCLEKVLSSFNKEVFFPLLTLVCFNGDEKKVVDEMITLINNNPFGLRTSVWTQETTVIESFSRGVNSMGILRFNEDHCVTPTYSSFWGGPGRSGGPYGELNLFWQKTTHLQSIDCTKLSKKEVSAVLIGVGCSNLVSC